jgi:UDP-N-acetyl-D-glucosamine dehydrogenase
MLQRRGAQVSYTDPHIPELPHMRHHDIRLQSEPLTEAFCAAQDCFVIVTDHTLVDYGWLVQHARLIVDTRNATDGCTAPGCRIWKG